MSVTTTRLIKLQTEIRGHEAEMKRLCSRIILACSDVRDARSGRDANLDDLLVDVQNLLVQQALVTDKLREIRELGNA